MKLFLISNMYPDKKSPGYGVFVKNVADYLSNNDIHISYSAVIKGRSKNIIHKIIKYLYFYCRIIMLFFKDYDAIYVHYPNMAIPVLLPLFKIQNRKLIINYHGEDLLYSGRLGSMLGKMTEDFVRKYADVVVVPSDFFKKILLERTICDTEKIIVFPSGGIDPRIFYPSPKIKTGILKLGYVGRIEYGKGWKEFILALSKLKSTESFRGYIVGYGTLEQEMHELISQYNLCDKIELIKGVTQRELQYYYSLFDLLIFTTQLPESLGLVGLESMACGTPIIATDIGGIATYARNNHNGYLVAKGDVDGVVRSIERFMQSDETEKLQMIDNCLETARKYSIETIYISFLNELKKHLYF